jgi:hypothetical protein
MASDEGHDEPRVKNMQIFAAYGLFFANAASELDYEIVKAIRRR